MALLAKGESWTVRRKERPYKSGSAALVSTEEAKREKLAIYTSFLDICLFVHLLTSLFFPMLIRTGIIIKVQIISCLSNLRIQF